MNNELYPETRPSPAPGAPTPKPRSVQVHLEHVVDVAPPEPSEHVLRVAAMFGLGADTQRRLTVLAPCPLTLRGGGLVFVTGPSGSGKSTLLRRLDEALADREDADAIDFDALPPLHDAPLVDALPAGGLDDRLRLLSLAGLGDAPVLLRRPDELSDGQRYRLRLAQAVGLAEAAPGDRLLVVLADEFGATLDRPTARNIATQLRRWTRRQPAVCVVCATTHDDLLEPLDPDVLVDVSLGESVRVHEREDGP